MMKVTGIKCVDLRIEAEGYGVVNYNGSMPMRGPDGTEVNNHTLPKLRGYTNLTGRVKERTEDKDEYLYKKTPFEIDFKKNPMYVSQNCIRHHLFREEANDLHFLSKSGREEGDEPKGKKKKGEKKERKDSSDAVRRFVRSLSGLLRGFVVPNASDARKTTFFISDFVDQLGNGNFEQFANCGEKDSNSIFSKITFGETKYLATASVSIENIQFLSLDTRLGGCSFKPKSVEDAIKLADELTEFLNELCPDAEEKPEAKFGYYYRLGTIFPTPERGIMLNDAAIDTLINAFIEKVSDLSFRQAKGWLQTTKVEVDYNSSKKIFRVKDDPTLICETRTEPYAKYFAPCEEE